MKKWLSGSATILTLVIAFLALFPDYVRGTWFCNLWDRWCVDAQELPDNEPLDSEVEYNPLDLSTVQGTTFWQQNQGLVAGEHTLEGIPFEFGWTFMTRGCGNGTDTIMSINGSYHDTKSVYILLHGGNFNINYSGDTVGTVRLLFSDGTFVEQQLVIGNNVRSWTRGDVGSAETMTSSNLFEAIDARGESTVDGQSGGIDILRIDTPQNYQGKTLSAIIIEDTSEVTMDEIYGTPCLHIQGITIETLSS
jgi:hypothetical protein